MHVMVVVLMFQHDMLIFSRLDRDDVHFGRTDSAAVHGVDFDMGIHAQRLDRSTEQFWLHARMHQRAQHHVATDPREAVQVRDPHALPPAEVNWLTGSTEFIEPDLYPSRSTVTNLNPSALNSPVTRSITPLANSACIS